MLDSIRLNCGPAAAPARTVVRLARRHLEEPERCALRVAEDREAPAREVHRRDPLFRARLRCGLERLVDVATGEIDQPVAGHLCRNHGLHLLPAGDALAAELELCIRGLVRTHRSGLGAPAENLLIERDRLVDAA